MYDSDGTGCLLKVANADAGSDTASAELSGVAPDQTLILRIPRGQRGNPGPPATAQAIRTLPDYDNTTAPKDGQVLSFTTSSQKFLPTTSPKLVGPFVARGLSSPENGYNAETIVARLTVSALLARACCLPGGSSSIETPDEGGPS